MSGVENKEKEDMHVDDGKSDEVESGKKTGEKLVKEVKQVDIKIPAEKWKVHLSLDEIDEDIELIDIEKLLNTYLVIRKKFFDDFLEVIQKINHYSVGKAIESVVSFDGSDWTKNSWLLVMCKQMKDDATFWMLFKREQNLSGVLVGIGPDEFVKAFMELLPKDFDSRNEYLKKLLIWLTVEPGKWKNVGVFIPNWL
ncbi:MAG: hypothetical protein ACTSVI_11580 [Promethearchaeota archaeon]